MFQPRFHPITESQGGYFYARQARAAGDPKAVLSQHLKNGKLLHVRRGVSRLTQFPETPHADLIVAWLAAGEKVVLSHESTPLLYGLTDRLPGEIHLTAPRTASPHLAGAPAQRPEKP